MTTRKHPVVKIIQFLNSLDCCFIYRYLFGVLRRNREYFASATATRIIVGGNCSMEINDHMQVAVSPVSPLGANRGRP